MEGKETTSGGNDPVEEEEEAGRTDRETLEYPTSYRYSSDFDGKLFFFFINIEHHFIYCGMNRYSINRM